MRGEDVRTYLALNLRTEADAGRPLDQILGLHPITLDSYAVGAPISQPEQTGFFVIPALLSYQGFSEERRNRARRLLISLRGVCHSRPLGVARPWVS